MMKLQILNSAVAFFFLFFLHVTFKRRTKLSHIAYNGLDKISCVGKEHNLIKKTMDINDEIDMQDLKYKVKELQEKNEELQVELEITKEQLILSVVSQQRELLLAFADYSDYRNDKSQYIARYMIDDFLEANNCG